MHGCLFFVMPMAVGLMVVSTPLVEFIYGDGQFDAFAVEITGQGKSRITDKITDFSNFLQTFREHTTNGSILLLKPGVLELDRLNFFSYINQLTEISVGNKYRIILS